MTAFGRVGDLNAIGCAVAEGVFDLLSEPSMVDDDFSDTGGGQVAQVPTD